MKASAILRIVFVPLFVGAILSAPVQALAAKKDKGLESGIYPALNLSYDYDNNVYRLDNSRVQIEDDIYSIEPSITLKSLLSNKHPFELIYFADIRRYKINTDEDSVDHYLDLSLGLNITKKLLFKMEGDWASAHETRGASGTRISLSEEPDYWWAGRLKGTITYGRREAKNQIGLMFEGYQRRYTNNAQETRDRNQLGVALTYYRNRAKSQWLIEGAFRSYDYFDKRAPIDLTSREGSLMLGMTWEATAKTTGILKLGYLVKDMTDPEIPDFGGWSAETEVEWEPRTFFVATLNLTRATKESPHTIGSYYVGSEVDLKMRYDIMKSLHLRGEIFFEKDDYEAITQVQRNDQLLDGSLELAATPRKWFEVGLRYVYTSRRSNLSDIDYNANIYTVYVTFDTEGKVREQ